MDGEMLKGLEIMGIGSLCFSHFWGGGGVSGGGCFVEGLI